MVRKFRSIPVEVEAVRYYDLETSLMDVLKFTRLAFFKNTNPFDMVESLFLTLGKRNEAGALNLKVPNDSWVIKNGNGDFSVMSHEEFQNTYSESR